MQPEVVFWSDSPAERAAVIAIASETTRRAVAGVLQQNRIRVVDILDTTGVPEMIGNLDRCRVVCIVDYQTLGIHQLPALGSWLSFDSGGHLASLLLCSVDEYPDAPHESFDLVMNTPIQKKAFWCAVKELFTEVGPERWL